MSIVAKGTPPGFDVGSAVDYLLSFNSGWPLLKIDSTNVYSSAVTHNLGYPPFFLITSSIAPGGVDVFSEEFGVDATQFVRNSGSATPRYYIFRLDLTTDFTATQTTGTATASTKNDGIVFKMSKPGADISSTDMRDFSLHSNTRSPMVHMVRHGSMSVVSGGWGATVNHNLGYVPTVFVFIKPNANSAGLAPGRYASVPTPVGVDVFNYQVDSTSVTVFADGSLLNLAVPEYSVVILKDPFVKETVNVSYP